MYEIFKVKRKDSASFGIKQNRRNNPSSYLKWFQKPISGPMAMLPRFAGFASDILN
jgi:hypothetical protein